jgi:DNA repair protein RadC
MHMEGIMTTAEPPTRRPRRTQEPTPAQALREAITPYIALPRLRRLIAEHGDLYQALRCPTPPPDVLAVLELLSALLHPNPRDQIKSPTDAAGLLMLDMSTLDQEHLRTVLLDTKNRVQTIVTVYVGSVNTAMIRVGEVFKAALAWNSAALIVVHNHPSGDPTPSPEDVLITHQIVEAGKLLDVDVLDHLVIGQGRYCSMREKALGFSR